MRYALLLVLCSGCTSTPIADPLAPTVMADIRAPLECPEPELRMAPPDLVEPITLPVPEVLPAGQGDYGMTREGMEQLIDILRTAKERLARWRAWAE